MQGTLPQQHSLFFLPLLPRSQPPPASWVFCALPCPLLLGFMSLLTTYARLTVASHCCLALHCVALHCIATSQKLSWTAKSALRRIPSIPFPAHALVLCTHGPMLTTNMCFFNSSFTPDCVSENNLQLSKSTFVSRSHSSTNIGYQY